MSIVKWARAQWDRLLAWVLVFIGGIAIVVAWNAVSGEALVAQQVPYIVSGGIGGLFLLGVGGFLWISADLRDEWRKLDSIERAMSEKSDQEAADSTAITITPDAEAAPRTNGRLSAKTPRRP